MRAYVFLLSLLTTATFAAPLKVVTTTTDLAWAVKAIGGPLVEVRALLKGTENPHYVDTVPDFIRYVADAQVVCLVGLDLEVGWMPKVLARSGNAAVQPGGKGYCDASETVTVLEKPTGPVDRTMGDVHPHGNSHYWLSPNALGEAAVSLEKALAKNDPAHTGEYRKGREKLQKDLAVLVDSGKQALAPHVKSSALFLEYHKEFTYFFQTYGLVSQGSIEEKPGIPPSAGRIAEVALAAKSAGVRAALAGLYAPESVLKRFTELSGVPTVRVPTSIQAAGPADDYPKFQRTLIDAIVKALASAAKSKG